MMRPMILAVAPVAPSNLVATAGRLSVRLTWTDNSRNETSFIVQRALSAAGPWTTITTLPSTTGPETGATVTYTDTSVARLTTYYYRVLTSNLVGYSRAYPAPAAGYPHMSADSPPSSIFSVTTR